MHTNKFYSCVAEELPDLLYRAVDSILFDETLQWVIAPKKLAARKELSGPATITSMRETDNEFYKKVRQGEATDAKKAADAKAEQQIRDLVSCYQPQDSAGRFQYGKRETVQSYLTKKYVGKPNPQFNVPAVRAEVRKLQDADEKLNEKL
jgi:hypothetical protein